MLGLPPNHRTQQVDSFGDEFDFGAGTILPGHAVCPRTAPQTNSPTLNVDDAFKFVGVTIDEFALAACDVGGDEVSTSFFLVVV